MSVTDTVVQQAAAKAQTAQGLKRERRLHRSRTRSRWSRGQLLSPQWDSRSPFGDSSGHRNGQRSRGTEAIQSTKRLSTRKYLTNTTAATLSKLIRTMMKMWRVTSWLITNLANVWVALTVLNSPAWVLIPTSWCRLTSWKKWLKKQSDEIL